MSNSRFYCDIMAMHPEVTGSCVLVIVKLPSNETIRFVVDCGLFQERDYFFRVNPYGLQKTLSTKFK